MNVMLRSPHAASRGLVLLLLLAAGTATELSARTVLTCEDAAGERFFSERCPPGTRQVDSRRIATGATPAAGAPEAAGEATDGKAAPGLRRLQPVTVYTAPDCVPCEFVERHLETRRVAFTRVDVEADPAAFAAVRDRLDTVGVPVLTVGGALLTGFQPRRIDEVLVAEGVLLATDVPDRGEPAAEDAAEDAADAPAAPAAPPPEASAPPSPAVTR